MNKAAGSERYIHPRPRLSAALTMLTGAETLADIGCDHGRLSCAAVQRGTVGRAIAIDISDPSLDKARMLAAQTGVADRVETRLGDGFMPLCPGEADAAAMLGMGGTLMTRLLDACPVPMMGAKLVVCQPMRAVADIRRYLYEHGYHIRDDRVVRDAGRLYQVFCATLPGTGVQALPTGWPQSCFHFGYTAFAVREPLLPELIRARLSSHERRLHKGDSETLLKECADLRQILEMWGESVCS